MVRPDRGVHPERVRGFIEEPLEKEQAAALGGGPKHEAKEKRKGYPTECASPDAAAEWAAASVIPAPDRMAT